jgi:hypothetical protein
MMRQGVGDKDEPAAFKAVGNELASLHPRAQKSSRRICTRKGDRRGVAYGGNRPEVSQELLTVDHAAYSALKGRSES